MRTRGLQPLVLGNDRAPRFLSASVFYLGENMPSELQNARTFFLISAIMNILVMLGWGTTTIMGGLVTCGIGCLMGALPLVNVISCVLDFIAYNKLNNLNRYDTYKTMQTAAIMDIVTIITGNVVSLVFGILTLNYLGNENVKNFLKEKGIY